MRPNFKPFSGGIDSRESSHFSEELDDKDYSTQAVLKIQGALSEYFLQSPDLVDDWNNHAMPEDASAMSMQKAHHIRTTTFKPHISAADMDGLVSMLQPLPVESANVDVQQLIRSILRQHEEVAGLASPSMMRETACWGSEVVDRGTYHGAHGDHSTHELHPSSPEVEESVALALSLGESKIDPRMLSQQYFRQLSLL